MFRYLYWGGDTAHNTTYYSESGGDTTQENVFKYLYWVGDTAHNTTYYSESGGDTAHDIVFRCHNGVGTPPMIIFAENINFENTNQRFGPCIIKDVTKL